jgi:hypothetical protein
VTIYSILGWHSPKQLDVLAKCQNNRKVRDVLKTILGGIFAARVENHLQNDTQCSECKTARETILQQSKANEQDFQQECEKKLTQSIGKIDAQSTVQPQQAHAATNVAVAEYHDALSRKRLADLPRVREAVAGKTLSQDECKTIDELFQDPEMASCPDLIARHMIHLHVCAQNDAKSIRTWRSDTDTTVNTVWEFVSKYAFPALMYHVQGVRKGDAKVRLEARESLVPLKFSLNSKLYDRMVWHDLARRRWTMNSEYAEYMAFVETILGHYDRKGLDEIGEEAIREIKRGTGHSNTDDGWDRANFLLCHWKQIEERLRASLGLRRQKARRHTDLDREDEILAVRQLFRTSGYLRETPNRGLVTLDGKPMPAGMSQIFEHGARHVEEFAQRMRGGADVFHKFTKEPLDITHTSKKTRAKALALQELKLTDLTFEKAWLTSRKITIAGLKKAAELLGDEEKEAKNKEAWAERVLKLNQEREAGKRATEEKEAKSLEAKLETRTSDIVDMEVDTQATKRTRAKRRSDVAVSHDQELQPCYCDSVKDERTIACEGGSLCKCGGYVHISCAGRPGRRFLSGEVSSFVCKEFDKKKSKLSSSSSGET